MRGQKLKGVLCMLYHGGMHGNKEGLLGCNKNLPLSLSFLSGKGKLEGLCGCSFGICDFAKKKKKEVAKMCHS